MNLRALALLAGVAGGLLWIARWGTDLAGSDPDWGETARWVGLGLLIVALAVVGGGLVSKSATWLRVLVAVAFPLLVWSVYAVVRGDSESIQLDGVIGIVAVVLALVALLVGRGRRRESERRGPGAHSAR